MTTRASSVAARRRARRAEIVRVTRELFDERGLRDANMDDIARAVGVNRAIIYRHFASKDELFALTLAGYLEELDVLLERADDPAASTRDRLAAACGVLADYGLQHPAFLDCAIALTRQPGEELLAEIGGGALVQLGRLMGATTGRIAAILRSGAAAGDLAATGAAATDADLLATTLWMQGLGALHLARTGFYVRSAGGGPQTVPVDEATVRRTVVGTLVAAALGPP